MKNKFSLIFICVFSAAGAHAIVQEARDHWENEFHYLRVQSTDLELPAPTDLPYTIGDINRFYKNPLEMPEKAEGWGTQIESAVNSASLAELAYQILIGTTPMKQPLLQSHKYPDIPKSMHSFYANLRIAQRYLSQAVNSISAEERTDFLKLMGVPLDESGTIKQEISARRIKSMYGGMKNFDQQKLLEAGLIIMKSIDENLSQFKTIEISTAIKTWNTELGTILVGGPGDNVYTKDLMDQAILIIDLGGHNTYDGPVAAAGENEIRILIDYGSDITITSNENFLGNAGSGIFGIGLIYLPNENGKKTFTSGSFAQGCGMAGIGGVFSAGEIHFDGGRHVQGSGTFGLGILKTRSAHGSTLSAFKNGQGAGFVRGVGILSHEGNNSEILGGLSQPDPREPLGSVSICQGVGMGQRAYSGGGVGVALINGDGNHVEGSYFAQGVGYWNSLGIFKMNGNKSHVQARRYDQGSGVHYAFGYFHLNGNQNRVLNWGVGPGYGWDRSLGVALMEGDENEFQVEWGAATADIGSLSFGYYKGNKNKFKLPSLGYSSLLYNNISYGLHAFIGKGNVREVGLEFEAPGQRINEMLHPWGLNFFEDVVLVKTLNLVPPQWREQNRKESIEREMADLQAEIKTAEDDESSEDKVASLIDVASAFSLDKESPRQALEKLMLLTPLEAPQIIQILEPAAVDQLIRIQLILVAHGNSITTELLENLNAFDQKKNLMLLNFLGRLRASGVMPELLKRLKSPDQRERLTALGGLGQLLNEGTGNEPGIRAGLKKLEDYLSKRRPAKNPKKLIAFMGRYLVYDAFGILSQAIDSSGEDRIRLLKASPEDITSSLGEAAAKELLTILRENKDVALARIKEDIDILNSNQLSVRDAMFDLLKSTHPADVRAGIITLGQINNADDASKLPVFLSHEKASVREAAAVALGRMGDAGLPYLLDAFKTGEAQLRNQVITSLRQAVVIDSQKLFELGLQDSDSMVRLTAVGTLRKLPPILEPHRKKMIRKAKKLLKNESDPSVRFALAGF